ncbi:hypothetical protein [Helicobacter sp. T3_23-1056]
MNDKKPQKRLAICFFGHLRTFNQTCESFFKNIVEVNRNDEWQIDIFMHTWDEFEKAGFAWHNYLASLDGKKVTQDDINQVLRIYEPKKFLIETLHQERGMDISLSKTQELARDYAKEQNLNYDYTLILRPDLYFKNPLRLNTYIEWYKDKRIATVAPLPPKHIFTAHNIFGRMPVADPRYICEADLLWFGNFNPLPFVALPNEGRTPVYGAGYVGTIVSNVDFIVIPINYRFGIDFFIQRISFREPDFYNGVLEALEKFEKLKKLEHFSGFALFYANKKMAKLRIATRKIRYPIKDFFKRLFSR